MSQARSDDKFDNDESQKRFEAALRGARAAEPHPMKDIPHKRSRKQTRRKRETNDASED